MGLDSREVTPQLTKAVVHLAGEIRSFERVEIATDKVLGQKVSRSTVRRLAKQVGLELAKVEEAGEWTEKEVIVPEIAVVSCDGGRIRTREPGRGRGVHLSGENGWRETKNSSLERMCKNAQHARDDDPHKPLADAIRYLTNNRTRMDYPRYRRLGLPVTSAPMESLIKQINFRVKGTEMFWDDPEGAEAILHIRSALLSEDDRFDDYLSNRPGWQFQRRTTAPTVAA